MSVEALSPWPLVARDREIEIFRKALIEPGRQAFMVHGAAGTGKTRLAEECLELAQAEGLQCARAVASEAARAIPLGAVAHLLPTGVDPGDPVSMFARVIERYSADGQRVVLFVDDLHLLDATSTVLIQRLLDAGTIFLIGTVRSGAATGPAEASFDRADRARRIDLAEFTLDQVDGLLRRVLAGPVEPSTSFQLHQASGGVLLFLRELVHGALAAGRLIGDGGLWRLIGAPMGTRRLADVIGHHLDIVSGDDRRVLEIVGLCGPMGTHGLDPEVLGRLERAGLVRIRVEQRRTTVSMAHPLYGEILRSRVPQPVRRGLLIEQAGRVRSTGMRRAEDRLSVAMWLLNATGTADPELLASAAELARYTRDFESVVRLSTALAQIVPGAGPRMLRGEALYELGRFDEADDALREAAEAAGSDEEYLLTTLLHTQSLAWGAARIEEALVLNSATRERLTTRSARDALNVDRAALLLHNGEIGQAAKVSPSGVSAEDPRTRVMGALPHSFILVESGHIAEAITLSQSAHEEHVKMPAVMAAAHPGLQYVARVYALVESGRMEEARALGELVYAQVVADGALIAQMWVAIVMGMTEYTAGRMARARTWFATAATVAADHHFRGGQWPALAGLALAAAAMGDLNAFDTAWQQSRRLSPQSHRRADVAAVPGWGLAARGDLRGARDVLMDAADLAQETGSVIIEARALTDIARLGDPVRVRDRLDRLAAATDSPLTAARAAYVRASATDDREGLEQVAAHFEAMGVMLLAAEAYARVAELCDRGQDTRRAAAALHHVQRLTALCDGARIVGAFPSQDDSAALTAREREIALLTISGLSSKEVADRLVISARTVDNHLQSIYRKTGVTGRRELRKVMTDPAG